MRTTDLAVDNDQLGQLAVATDDAGHLQCRQINFSGLTVDSADSE